MYFYLSSHLPKSSHPLSSSIALLLAPSPQLRFSEDRGSSIWSYLLISCSESIFSLPQNLILRGLNMTSCKNVDFMLTWSVCIPVCICLATYKCITQLQPNLIEDSSLKNSKFPQGLSRQAEVEERCPTSTEEKAAILCWAFIWCWRIHLGESTHLGTPPTGRTSISTRTFSGAPVNQAQGNQDFIVLVLMELLVFFQVAFSLKSYQPFESMYH